MGRRERWFWIGIDVLVAATTLVACARVEIAAPAAILAVDGLVLGVLLERERVAWRIRRTMRLSERWLTACRHRDHDPPT